MNSQPSPLNCVSYFVTDLIVAANPDYKPVEATHLKFQDLQIECKIEKPHQPEEMPKHPFWRILLKIAQNVGKDKNTPYNFSIAMLGHFSVHPGFPKDKIEQLVSVNGCSMLYSTAREILRSAMGHGPYRPLILPTVTFLESEGPERAVPKESSRGNSSENQ